MYALSEREKRQLKYTFGGILIALVGMAALLILSLLPPIFMVGTLIATGGGLVGWTASQNG